MKTYYSIDMLKYLWIGTNKRELARCKTIKSCVYSRQYSSTLEIPKDFWCFQRALKGSLGSIWVKFEFAFSSPLINCYWMMFCSHIASLASMYLVFCSHIASLASMYLVFNAKTVHHLQRIRLIRKRKNSSEPNKLPKKSLRLCLEQGFDWKQNCFYCGKLCLINEQHPERNDSHLVETLHLREKLLSMYRQRSW